MAERMLRRGLPRVVGGEPWPPALIIEVAETATPVAVEPVVQDATPAMAATAEAGVRTAPVVDAPSASVPSAAVVSSQAVALRRGLPRTEGGAPWPAVSATPAAVSTPAAAPVTVAASASPIAATPDAATPAQLPVARSAVAASAGESLRRGLPRVEGGEPWPPAGTAARIAAEAAVIEAVADPVAEVVASGAVVVATHEVAPHDVSAPLPFTRTVWQGQAPRHATEPEPEVSRFRPSWPMALGGLMGAAALGIIAAAGVALVRALLSMTFMQDFMAMFPGEYHLPETAEVGFPAWVGWQHFFNIFLMVLIIRSGLRVRSEKRPTVFWTARGNAKNKISLTLWFHQALDILWLVNGVIFVVLLFVTGHWMRIVPTSWEVFPNALSAMLQYISLDWPTDNGWVNYNSLQQLAYFTTVFIAAPLAAITGVRMSGLWPKKAERLSKMYPVEWARALHFPIMLYFVAFIAVHVALVMFTGMLRNLNHMFAAQGSVDPTAYAGNWLGFWIFIAAMIVVVSGWVAARPLVLAPIAKLFGNVSGR